MPDERKLAAIVFSDIVGFTELMNSDEKAAMDLLKKQRTLLRPIIENFDGEWLKEMGDGILTSFPSAVKAATCALEIQRILEHDSKLTIRIGIHIGDIITKDGDVFGDGVNIASRMEQLAEPGGICISERVHDDIRNKPEINTVFQDEQILKGIAKPIKVYSIFTQMGSIPNKNKEFSNSSSKTNKSSVTNALLAVLILLLIGGISYFFVSSKLPLTVSSGQYSDSNSIAVLPFSNFSKNPDDQYFSDGLTEVIIANLSKVRTLKVISRTSVMQFKNSTKSLKEIGKELGVAYILEGSVQKGSNRIRIVGQLIDTQTDDNIWAETYDSELTDLFDIQINVAKNIAEVIKGELSNEEIDFLSIKTTENVEAWDYYLKAKELMSKSYSKPNMELSISLLNKAIKADSKFVEAYSMLTRIHLGLYWNGVDRTEERKTIAKDILDKGLKIDENNPSIRIAKGFYHYHGFRDYLRAIEEFKGVQQQHPGDGEINMYLAYIERRLGRFEDAIKNLEKTLRVDPKNIFLKFEIAQTYAVIHNYEKSFPLMEKVVYEESPDVSQWYSHLADMYIYSGNILKAIETLDNGLKIFNDEGKLLFKKAIAHHLNREFTLSNEILAKTNLPINTEQTFYTPRETIFGMNYHYLGNKEKSNEYLEKSRSILNEAIIKNPKDIRKYPELAKVEALLGDKLNAIKNAEYASSMIPLDKDAIIGMYHFISLTQVYALLKDEKNTIDNLERIRILPSFFSLELLKKDPVWDSIRQFKGYKEIIKKEFGKF